MKTTLTGWLKFNYNGKERGGLAIGPSTLNTNNLVVLTADGVRTFNTEKMEGVVDETTLYA